jgi:hypothetical protein
LVVTIDTVPLTVALLAGEVIVTGPDAGVGVPVGVGGIGVGVTVGVGGIGVGVAVGGIGVGVGVAGVGVAVPVGVEVLVPFSTSTVMLSEPTSVLLPLLLLNASMEIVCEPLATVAEFQVKLYGGLDVT